MGVLTSFKGFVIMCGVMTEPAQTSQEKIAFDSSAIYAFAIRRHDYFNVYVDFFTYNSSRFNYSFSKRELEEAIAQIDQAVASGELYFCANGKQYPMPAHLMRELRNSLKSHVVSANGGSDAQVSDRGLNEIPAARHSAKTQASAQVMPARQISSPAVHTKNGRTSVVIGTRKL